MLKRGSKLAKPKPKRKKSGVRRRIKPENSRAEKDAEQEIGIARETLAVILFVLGLFIFFALASHVSPDTSIFKSRFFSSSDGDTSNVMGLVGNVISGTLFSYLGWCSFILVAWALLLA